MPWKIDCIDIEMSRCIKYWDLIDKGEALKAALELDRLLVEDPEYTGAYYNLGLAFKALGMKNTAMQYFRTYLDIEPEGYHKERAVKALAELGEVEQDA
jgi:tetratricopeptide (TPR) repeat protein